MNFTLSVSFWDVLQLFILPILLPMAVGLISTKVTSSPRKALLLLALSVVTSFLTQLLVAQQAGVDNYNLGMALVNSLVTFVFGVGVQFGLLKPTGVTEALLTTGRTASTGTTESNQPVA
jgi:hypothetical protein